MKKKEKRREVAQEKSSTVWGRVCLVGTM